MNTLTINPRFSLLMSLAASTLSTAAAGANPLATEHVIVDASRPTTKVIAHSESGTSIKQMQLSGRVSYSDLELSIPSNAKVLKTRVHDAAHEICQRLDVMYPVTTVEDCTRRAVDDAKPQVNAAIAKSEMQRTASR
jgi:UrcA family protein